MLSTVVRIVAALAVGYAAIAILAWRYQERLAFPAPRMQLPEPAGAGLDGGTRVTLRAADGVTLYGWYLAPDPAPVPDRGAAGLLWFYGNMETVAALAPIVAAFRPPGMGMLVVDYRGYGESEGTPTEAGLYLDADAAWEFLAGRAEIDRGRIAVYGRSLGSALALYAATTKPVQAVILDSPFSSGADMAREHYWFLPRFLVTLSLDNVARAGSLTAPLMIFHGTDDRIAPIRMGRAVAEAGRAREFVAIERAGHNDTYTLGGAAYRDKVHHFVRTVLP